MSIDDFETKLYEMQRQYRERMIKVVEIGLQDYAQTYSHGFSYVDMFMDLSNELKRNYLESYEKGGDEEKLLSKLENEFMGYEQYMKFELYK
jgi:hypothetical protein